MPARTRVHAILAVLLLAGAFGGLLHAASRASAGTAIIFQDTFESGALSTRWTVTDSNAAAGLDYWDVSAFRSHAGMYSAWSAQIGTQSSGAFSGMDNADPGVQQYDDNMQADLVIDLQVSGFASLTLSFWYYSKTENGGGDWIQAWYEVGGVPTVIFSPRGSTGNAWDFVSLSVPTTIDRLIIRFRTDAANHNFEGAYVDDVILTGVEDVAPTSSVSALPASTNQVPVSVPYVAQDNLNASGVAYVELWYRVGGVGTYVLYTTSANPSGRWTTSPVPFEARLAAGDGAYEFYSIAVDWANNTETAPGTADASMIIDTTGPVVSFVTPTDGVTVGPSEFTARWTASDALSSIARYEISFDGGSFADVGLATSRSYANVSDGPHSIVVRAYDSLGNMGEIRANFFVGVPPAAGFPWWILAVILAALLGVLFFLLWKRRKDEEEDALAKAAEAGAAPAEVAEEPPIPSPLPPDPLPEPAPPPPEPDPEIRLEPPTPPL